MVKPLANYLQLVPAEPFPPGWKRRLYGRHGCPPLLQTSHFLLANNDLQIKFRFVPDHDVPSGKLPPPNPLLSGLHFRGHLPHLKKEGAAYFVTFRLADSLPAGEIVRLKQERQAILEQSRAAKRPLTWHEEQQLLAWYCDRVESLLDAGRGACWLSQPAVADLVADALRFFAGQRYELRAWVVMPNHVHAIVWPMPGHILSDILHSWKSFTSKRAQQILPMRDKAFWQSESFNHWIRDDAERARLAAYVENNPCTAGLCQRPEDWKCGSAGDRLRQKP